MGTGAMDTATPLDGNRRNETATGTSLIAGTFVKRSKRALRSITADFLNPLVQKIMWRRMDFDGINYPTDFQFRVATTLGIVAREIEQGQMTGLLQYAGDKPQTQAVLINAIFDNSSSPYKAQITQALKADAEPNPADQAAQQMQQQIQQLQMQGLAADNQVKQQEAIKKSIEAKKLESDIHLNFAKIEEMGVNGAMSEQKGQLEVARLLKELEEVKQFARQVDVSMIKVIREGQSQSKPSGGTDNGTDTN